MSRFLAELERFGFALRAHPECPRIFVLPLALRGESVGRLLASQGDGGVALDRIAYASLLAEHAAGVGVVFFRAVPAARTSMVCATGIDVHPSTAPFAATQYLEKAAEYGGAPKLVMLLDSRKLAPTFRTVSATIDKGLLAKMRVTHPTMITVDGGATLWLSRLSANHPSLGPHDEAHYMSWIPGDAREAFLGGLILEDAPIP